MTHQSINPLPRWRGFNLLEKFEAKEPSKSTSFYVRNPSFQELDFQWISDWGFNFVRLPMSYHCWSRPEQWFEIDEAVLEQIDEAIYYGQKYDIHVCLNLHRAPGYCVNPPAEPLSLWKDSSALEACSYHWHTFSKRYKGIPPSQLSFDLLNEPLKPGEQMSRQEHEHVIRRLVEEIRKVDPDRLIIADGLNYGNDPIPELVDLKIHQSCRAYIPMGISHYQASWVNGEKFPAPKWPGGDHYGESWDRNRLASHYQKWAELFEQGVGVHCGEGGCFNKTSHEVFLSWFRDVLEILTGFGIGYALWNFRGSFGLIDSNREDVDYMDWHGHLLDQKLLLLLQQY